MIPPKTSKSGQYFYENDRLAKGDRSFSQPKIQFRALELDFNEIFFHFLTAYWNLKLSRTLPGK